MRGLLDTSVIIANEVSSLPDEGAISAATLAELHFGVDLAKTSDQRRQRVRLLAEVEARFDPLPIDASVARAYGVLAHATLESGRKPRARVMDTLIAATAYAHSIALYTRDRRDFEPFERFVHLRIVR